MSGFRILIVSLIGPAFLSATVSNIEVPKGTDSADAIDVFQANYPSASSWPPIFVVSHTDKVVGSVINSYTKQVASDLDSFAKTCNAIDYVSGYWQLISMYTYYIYTYQTINKFLTICLITFL